MQSCDIDLRVWHYCGLRDERKVRGRRKNAAEERSDVDRSGDLGDETAEAVQTAH